MLWDLIFNFYVTKIFGGILNGIEYKTTIGSFKLGTTTVINDGLNSLGVFYTDYWYPNQTLGLPLGNYLSLIATIITMVIILLVIGHFIKKTFNLFGRII